MRKTHLKRISLAACTLILCLAALGPTAALADGFATYGNAQNDITFYVAANGPSSVTLAQLSMGQARREYIELYSAGLAATDQIYAQYTVQYRGSMDTAWRRGPYWTGATCVLSFPQADIYTVRILPTNIRNIPPSVSKWRYVSWISVPSWYVSGMFNCSVSANYPYSAQPIYVTPTPAPYSPGTPYVPYGSAPVTFEYWDVRGGSQPMDWEVQYLTPGTHAVPTTRTFNGYTLVGVTSPTVTVSASGYANPSKVYLLYRYQEPAPAARKEVKPAQWDTQFKKGASSVNATRYKELPNLSDNKRTTAFKWTIKKAEWQDDVPELTAYFNGKTVGAIAIRNGDTSSSKNYKNNCRATQWRVRVWTRDGKYQDNVINMKDAYSTAYQEVALQQKYKKVDRIEFFLVFYQKGAVDTSTIYVSDIQFYEE